MRLSPWLLKAWGPLVLLAMLSAWGGAQHIDREKLQQQAAAKRQAVGPWEQVAAIESYVRKGIAGPPSVPGNINTFAFIGGGRFALADGKHPVRVLSADTGELLCSFGEPEEDGWYPRQIVSSADGRLLMLLPDAEPAIWDTQNGACVARLPRFVDRYQFACFLEDGRSFAVYRGERTRGKGPGNLQIWTIDAAKQQVALQQSIDADEDARGIELVGPFLLLKNHRRSQIFDATTRAVLLQQPWETDEEFLFLDPPRNGTIGRYGSLVFSQKDTLNERIPWTKQTPELRLMELPAGGQAKEVRRWKCPIEEGQQNDHRYQARYTMSPDREAIAISQEGRVNFFRFLEGTKLCTIPANNKYDHPRIIFADNQRVFVGQQRWGEKISLVEIPSGKEVAALPDGDYYPVVSSDGRHVLTRREMMPVDETTHALMSLPRPLVVLWKQVGQ